MIVLKKFYPKLTGGTFFILLTHAKLVGISKRKQQEGVKTDLTDYELLEGLLKIAQSSHNEFAKSTMKNNTTQFKNCEKWCTSWLPFNDQAFIAEFTSEFKDNYSALLVKMNEYFINYLDYTNSIKMNKLGRAILELISLDDSIDENCVFFINDPTLGIPKKSLTPETNYAIQQLILGVWLFIIQHKIDNTLGKETYLNWYKEPAVSGRQWVFVSNIGDGQYKDTIITLTSDLDIKMDISSVKITNNSVAEYNFTNYLASLKKKYSSITTFLYIHEPRPFESFYICNDLVLSSQFSFCRESYYYSLIDEKDKVKNGTVSKIVSRYSNFIILSGTGGLGKTMMINHLLLECIDSFDKNHFIPILVKLREINCEYSSLFDFIYSSIKSLCNISETQLTNLLSKGKVVLLLDGLDEIKTEYVNDFQKKLESFTDKFSDNIFIMSTRPSSSLGVFSRFKQLELLPLSKEQSMGLIKKLDFRPDDITIKERFLEKLNKTLYSTHTSFANNPLLLTIMLITFEYYKDIPSKMYKFYQEAYNALVWKHDKTKIAFSRQWKTDIDPDTYEEYLMEFSFRTYYKELFEFSYDDGKAIFDNMKVDLKYSRQRVKYNSFIYDLQNNLCLLLLDGTKYRYSHRSFQEFFCAKYLASKNDDDFYDIGMMFNNNYARSNSDQTFTMLEAMKPEKIERFVFIPFIEKIIKDSDSKDGLTTFIINHFKKIYYSAGDYDEGCRTSSSSYLLDYIMNKYHLPTLDSLDEYLDSAEIIDEFVYERYYFIDSGDDDGNVYSKLVKESNLEDDLSGLPNDDCAGWNLEIKTDVLFSNFEVYDELVNLITSYNSPFNKIFLALKELLERLKRKYQFAPEDTLFERL